MWLVPGPRGEAGAEAAAATLAASGTASGGTEGGAAKACTKEALAAAACRTATWTHALSRASSQRRRVSRATRSEVSAAASHSVARSVSVATIPRGDVWHNRSARRAASACSAALAQTCTTALTASWGGAPSSCIAAASPTSQAVADSPGARAPTSKTRAAIAPEICARIAASTAAVSVRAIAAVGSKHSSSRMRTCIRNSSQPPSTLSLTTMARSCARVKAR
eukprot:scaffold17717_cov112-Isochrysis_galbana.AAC.7